MVILLVKIIKPRYFVLVV